MSAEDYGDLYFAVTNSDGKWTSCAAISVIFSHPITIDSEAE